MLSEREKSDRDGCKLSCGQVLLLTRKYLIPPTCSKTSTLSNSCWLETNMTERGNIAKRSIDRWFIVDFAHLDDLCIYHWHFVLIIGLSIIPFKRRVQQCTSAPGYICCEKDPDAQRL